MLRAVLVAALSAALAAAQWMSPIQAIKQEMAALALPLPTNVCPFGPPGAIVSPGQRLGSLLHTVPGGTSTIVSKIVGHRKVLRCFLPGLTSEARIMHDRLSAGDVEQARAAPGFRAGRPRTSTANPRVFALSP